MSSRRPSQCTSERVGPGRERVAYASLPAPVRRRRRACRSGRVVAGALEHVEEARRSPSTCRGGRPRRRAGRRRGYRRASRKRRRGSGGTRRGRPSRGRPRRVAGSSWSAIACDMAITSVAKRRVRTCSTRSAAPRLHDDLARVPDVRPAGDRGRGPPVPRVQRVRVHDVDVEPADQAARCVRPRAASRSAYAAQSATPWPGRDAAASGRRAASRPRPRTRAPAAAAPGTTRWQSNSSDGRLRTIRRSA